jgi:hypothetical protein
MKRIDKGAEGGAERTALHEVFVGSIDHLDALLRDALLQWVPEEIGMPCPNGAAVERVQAPRIRARWGADDRIERRPPGLAQEIVRGAKTFFTEASSFDQEILAFYRTQRY